MPATAPLTTATAARQLGVIGHAIHARRKALGVNATHAAEAAGMSRVTLHRVERGEPSVTIGAYLNAAEALGLELRLAPAEAPEATRQITAPHQAEGNDRLPDRIRLADFAQLRRIAWHAPGATDLTPEEAIGIYERNWRHIDHDALDARERALIDRLAQHFGRRLG